jgi:hypothetical protein
VLGRQLGVDEVGGEVRVGVDDRLDAAEPLELGDERLPPLDQRRLAHRVPVLGVEHGAEVALLDVVLGRVVEAVGVGDRVGEDAGVPIPQRQRAVVRPGDDARRLRAGHVGVEVRIEVERRAAGADEGELLVVVAEGLPVDRALKEGDVHALDAQEEAGFEGLKVDAGRGRYARVLFRLGSHGEQLSASIGNRK